MNEVECRVNARMDWVHAQVVMSEKMENRTNDNTRMSEIECRVNARMNEVCSRMQLSVRM